MKLNVVLDNEQINEIANITADKVLATVQYSRRHEEWCDKEIKELKSEIARRDSMLVGKDLIIERLRETLRKVRSELKEIKKENLEIKK